MASEIRPSKILFKRYWSTDLSEDKIALSTQMDEIILYYGVVFCDTNNLVSSMVLYENRNFMVAKDSFYSLNQTIKLNNLSKPILFLGLVEIDEENSQLYNLKKFEQKIIHQPMTAISEIWQSYILETAATDDNLGCQLIYPQKNTNLLTVSGNQFTDSFSYFFEVIVE
jgi:hypothetical protein